VDRLLVLLSRCRALVAGRRLDEDFNSELRAHLRLLTEENIRRGMSPEEAARQANLRLGGVAQLEEQHRDDRSLPLVETTRQDVRYAIRALRKNPAYASVAIATLAIGIGAGTTVYSIAGAVLLRPLPYAEPDRLVRIFETNPLKGWARNIASPASYAGGRSRRLCSPTSPPEQFNSNGSARRRLPDRFRRAARQKSLSVTGNLSACSAPRRSWGGRSPTRRSGQGTGRDPELQRLAGAVRRRAGDHRQNRCVERPKLRRRRRDAARVLLPRA
jgi:hypothetical protein